VPSINQLNAVDTLTAGDLLPVYSSSNGDARKASISVLAEYVRSTITVADDKVSQYAAPSATGFTVQVNDDSDNIWLILTPTGGFAAGTIKLPALTNCIDRQEILVNCTQSVTALTINGNGATVTGAPTTLAVNAYFRLRFDSVTGTWYRVG
jgi:hypothetical protein